MASRTSRNDAQRAWMSLSVSTASVGVAVRSASAAAFISTSKRDRGVLAADFQSLGGVASELTDENEDVANMVVGRRLPGRVKRFEGRGARRARRACPTLSETPAIDEVQIRTVFTIGESLQLLQSLHRARSGPRRIRAFEKRARPTAAAGSRKVPP